MMTSEGILVDNLKESLKAVQRYIVIGTGASLFLLLLVLQEFVGEGKDVVVTVPVVGLPAASNLAAIIAVAAYWISGAMANIVNIRTQRIVVMLRSSKKICEAALTYPAISTIRDRWWRICGALLPALLGMTGAFLWGRSIGGVDFGDLFGIFFLGFPYLVLFTQFWYPLGDVDAERMGD